MNDEIFELAGAYYCEDSWENLGTTVGRINIHLVREHLLFSAENCIAIPAVFSFSFSFDQYDIWVT